MRTADLENLFLPYQNRNFFKGKIKKAYLPSTFLPFQNMFDEKFNLQFVYDLLTPILTTPNILT